MEASERQRKDRERVVVFRSTCRDKNVVEREFLWLLGVDYFLCFLLSPHFFGRFLCFFLFCFVVSHLTDDDSDKHGLPQPSSLIGYLVVHLLMGVLCAFDVNLLAHLTCVCVCVSDLDPAAMMIPIDSRRAESSFCHHSVCVCVFAMVVCVCVESMETC